jgi:hypothetical protein
MRYSSGIQTSRRILSVLAENRKRTQMELAHDIRRSRRTIMRQLRTLEDAKLICHGESRPASGKGRRLKEYELAFLGLISFLKYRFEETENAEERSKVVEMLAKGYLDLLPLVFGKWRLYDERGLKNWVIDRIHVSLKTQVDPIYCIEYLKRYPQWDVFTMLGFGSKLKDLESAISDITKLDEAKKIVEGALRDDFTTKILIKHVDESEFLNLLKFFRDDNELKEFVGNMLSEMEEHHQKYLTKVGIWIGTLEGQPGN